MIPVSVDESDDEPEGSIMTSAHLGAPPAASLSVTRISLASGQAGLMTSAPLRRFNRRERWMQMIMSDRLNDHSNAEIASILEEQQMIRGTSGPDTHT